jgi:hypothetical protein
MAAMAPFSYPMAMKNHLEESPIPVPSDAECAPPAEAISSRVRELRADYGFPVNQTRFMMLEAEAQLLALQRQNHCSIGLAIHG